MREIKARTVVVGSGCAGLNAADTLRALGEESLLLVTEDMLSGTSRNTGSDKQTYYKLSLSGDDGDSVGDLARDLHYPDVNGDTALCEAAASASCFFKLCSLGVPFPTNEYGEYVG
ncbi:MAG: oxidoreductase, partial [Clostridia bacterium]|nr:oxidoreductase [Clostridia bacterium]